MPSALIKRSVISSLSLFSGYVAFVKAWPDDSPELNLKQPDEQNAVILQQIRKSPEYQLLSKDDEYFHSVQSSRVPRSHQQNHVSLGLLFGPQRSEIDPLVFINHKNRELQAFYHLGDKLTSYDGKIHNGVLSTILDEFLCFCGFPYLPNKRGVTAKLSINFLDQLKPNSTIVLKAKVVEHKGRKVIIRGHLETLDKPSKKIADATCILVEPRWFKYFSWLSLF